MSSQTLILKAPAKLNLHLSVVGRRPDGYHLLQSLMVKLDLADRLTLTREGAGVALTVLGADVPCGAENLVYRAAQAFYDASGHPPGVKAVLDKRIPVAAGLGGGSSDAASTLLGLNELYDRPLTPDRLHEVGLSLGADIPFFLQPASTAWAEGIGEVLSPGPELPPVSFLLVNPGWPLSTAWVYKNVKLQLTKKSPNHISLGRNERSFTIGEVLHNDLESVVLDHYPEVDQLKQALLRSGAVGALMSGSGPTVFGVFNQRHEMDLAYKQLEREGEGKWIVIPAHLFSSA